MTPAAQAALVVLGVIVWCGLASCLAVAIGLTIRAANRREQPVVVEIEPDTEVFDQALAKVRAGGSHVLTRVDGFVTGEPGRREWYL